MESVQNVDGGIPRRSANAPGLSKIGDEERSAARLGQRFCDPIDSAAVGIALEDGRAFGVGALSKPFPIVGYCSQIDRQGGASLAFRRPFPGNARRQSFVVDDEAASPIDDFSRYRTVNDDVGTRL